jgi:hypothetical protein
MTTSNALAMYILPRPMHNIMLNDRVVILSSLSHFGVKSDYGRALFGFYIS